MNKYAIQLDYNQKQELENLETHFEKDANCKCKKCKSKSSNWNRAVTEIDRAKREIKDRFDTKISFDIDGNLITK